MASSSRGKSAVEAVAADVGALTDVVFNALDALASDIADLGLADGLTLGHLSDSDLLRLEELAVRIVEDADLIIGAGMAATPSDFSGSGLMHWWIARDDEVVAKHHVLNPRSDSFYDFSNSRWFQGPARHGVPTLIAPYVDSWGTDDLTVTAAVPACRDKRDLAVVVAADLNAREYIQAAEGLLRPIAPAVLVDTEGRAVASTEPSVETGVRLAALDAWSLTRHADIPTLRWSVSLLEHQDTV
jgi:hypothetical protein